MLMLRPDWRHVEVWRDQKSYMKPHWGAHWEIWHLTREAGEAALIPLIGEEPTMTPDMKRLLHQIISRIDYLHNSSCGTLSHLAARWKARHQGMK